MTAMETIEEEQAAENLAPQNGDNPAGPPPVAAGNQGGHGIASHVVASKPAPTAAVRRRLRGYAKTRARTAANRANAKKSTGPRTAKGKRRVSRNLPDPRASRLMGMVEARIFDQQPGAAEKLYREITQPYEPVPPLLAMHFHDLARLHLELETWERIRDAQIEERWRQSDIELRRRLHKLQQDLPKTAQEVFDKGLAGIEESPARVKQQIQCLWMLRQHLESHDFDMEPILHKLYGQALSPGSDRAEIICSRCDRLMHPEDREPLTDEQYDGLIGLVALEQRDATSAYGLYLDDAGMPRPVRLSRLASTRKNRVMSLEGQRLRQAIDRKQWVITGLLQTMGVGRLDGYGPGHQTEQIAHPSPPSNLTPPKATKPCRISKTSPKKGKIRRCQSHSGVKPGARN